MSHLEDELAGRDRTIAAYRDEVTRLLGKLDAAAEVVTWNRCATCDAVAAHRDDLRALVAEILAAPEVATYAPPASLAEWRQRADRSTEIN